MYKLSLLNASNKQTSVIRLSDDACIPFDPANTDYAEFKKAVTAGAELQDADGNVKGQWTQSLMDFDLVQILRYTEGGHYKWHNDLLPPENGTQRAASFVLLLNDPSEFEGGLLQIRDKSENLLKNKGDIVVFDSSAYHRVTPITGGVRYTAVCWARKFCKD